MSIAPNMFPGSYPFAEERHEIEHDIQQASEAPDIPIDVWELRHASHVALLEDIASSLRKLVGLWQDPPQQPRYEKITIYSSVMTPVQTRGARYVNIFCPGSVNIGITMEQQAVAGSLQLQPGWQPNLLYMTDQTMLTLQSGGPTTFLFEFRDDPRR